jgi:hypothetical protein
MAWLNFIRPLGISMTIDAASDWCVVTALMYSTYPRPFPNILTARRVLSAVGIDASFESLHDYARLLSAVGDRLSGNLAEEKKGGKLMNLWVTIKVEYEGEINTSSVTMVSVKSVDPERLCPDCLKQQILASLLARRDLAVIVEDDECRYHRTAEERRETGNGQ